MATKKQKTRNAAVLLNAHKESPTGDTAAVRAAARRLASGAAKKAGVAELRRRGSAGGKAAWASMTPTERAIEMRRRCRVRERNRKAKIQARINARLGRPVVPAAG
jgi:hypothetical protein